MKIIKYDNEARRELMKGVDELANAVKVTLGPKGRTVIIDRIGLDPLVTKDGVSVANEIELDDRLQNMGATVVKRVAQKSNDKAGDGTTTATVLTQAILGGGINLVSAGYDPIEIQRGINYAASEIVDELNAMTTNITYDSPMVEQIATISANNDKEIGKIVAEAFLKVGNDGAVSVEEGTGFETKIHTVDGLQFDRGMLSTFFSTSPEKAEVSLQNPLILVVDGKLTTTEEAMAILEPIVTLGRALLVIAEDVSGNALSTLTLNKMRGGHAIAAVKTPGFGVHQKEMAKDIASIVGGCVVTPEQVLDIEPKYIDQLYGEANIVKVEQMSTVIMGGQGTLEEKKERIADIDRKISQEKLTSFEVGKLEERKAKLGGGVAVIEVGAKSEIEMKEIKDRIDDAKEAVISALEEGVVIGGGSALMLAKSKALMKPWPHRNESFEFGVDLIMSAIESPLRTICKNANVSEDVVVDKIINKQKKNPKYGYNAKSYMYIDDMFSEGILDPKKVTRIALESAASVAGTLLTTQCAVIEKE